MGPSIPRRPLRSFKESRLNAPYSRQFGPPSGAVFVSTTPRMRMGSIGAALKLRRRRACPELEHTDRSSLSAFLSSLIPRRRPKLRKQRPLAPRFTPSSKRRRILVCPSPKLSCEASECGRRPYKSQSPTREFLSSDAIKSVRSMSGPPELPP